MNTYRQLMNSRPSMPEHLEQGALLTPGILAGPAFLNRLPRRVRNRFHTNEARLPFEAIVQYVSTFWGLRADEILSSSRAHRLVRARALIAWYATEHGGASLGKVSRFLRRDVSTLSRTVYRYRSSYPALFSAQAVAALRTYIEPRHTERQASTPDTYYVGPCNSVY